MLWLLALAGAAASWLGDICGTLAVRRGSPWGVWGAAVLFGLAAPAWCEMSRRTNGQFVRPAMIWNVAASTLSLVAAFALDGRPTPRQLAGLVLFFAALLVRG